MTDSDVKGKLDSSSPVEETWGAGDPLGRLLVFPHPAVKVGGKLHPDRSSMTNGPGRRGSLGQGQNPDLLRGSLQAKGRQSGPWKKGGLIPAQKRGRN